jgi:eukaryotic-like serine/threonine-protein kinase
VDPERWRQVKQIFLAAREQPSDQREAHLDSACGSDAELRREVASLLAADPAEGDSFMQAPLIGRALAVIGRGPSDVWIGRRIGPFRIVAELGRGGMGAVFRAVRDDAEFTHQVAIKVIRLGLDEAGAVTRFRRERQILANLKHPNIASLHDGGTTPEGLPYLIMELVEGVRIDDHCLQHRLPVDAILRLFLKVCDAVQFAHRHLVVHRDIKPSNILVTADGTPKLLDFGIAKLLDPGAPTASAVLLPMTPAYASPEQAIGGEITTATDVYSLGILLYELLAGRRPYEIQGSSPIAIQQAICYTEPAPPSRVVGSGRRLDGSQPEAAELLRRELDGDLDNIVLMALRKVPEQRYLSVEQLTQDVERFLLDLPIVARGDLWSYRAGKWLRRHRLGVAASSCIALSLVAGATAVAWQAGVARTQRDLAVRAASSMVYELAEGLAHMSGPSESRIGLLEQAARILDRVDDGGQPEQARLQADANRALAQTYRLLGDLGHAHERAERAQRIAQALGRRRAPTDDDLATAGSILIEAGDVELALSRPQQAASLYDEAVARLAAAARRRPLSGGARLVLANALSRKGDRLFAQEQPEAALSQYQRGAAIEQELLAQQSLEPRLHSMYATSLERLADVEDARGRTAAACQLYRRALVLRRAAVLAAASDPTPVKALALSLQLAGWCAEQEGRLIGAASLYREAIADERQLLDADPRNSPLTLNLAGALGTLGNLYVSQGDPASAIDWYRQAAGLTAALSLRTGSAEAERKDAALDQLLGAALALTGRRGEAQPWLRRAEAAYTALQRAEPHNLDDRHGMALTQADLADIELHQGRTAPALERFVAAEALCREVLAASRSSENLELAAEIGLGEARSHRRLGQVAATRTDLQRSLAALDELRQRGDLPSGSEAMRSVLPAARKMMAELAPEGKQKP